MTRQTTDEYRIRALIHPDRLLANVRYLKKDLPAGTAFCAVVKADAYGHGALTAAKALRDEADWFAVATAGEAFTLREAGIGQPILILGYTDPSLYAQLAEADVRVSILSEEEARALSDTGIRLGKKALCHIPFDTGMGRIGFPADREGLEAVKRIVSLPGLRAEGAFTHFARADEEDLSPAVGPFEAFLAMRRELAGDIELWHCSNSAALMRGLGTELDLVRGGIAMYGLDPMSNAPKEPLQPVMELKSTVTFVKTVPAGTQISYGGTYTAPDERRIATVPVGYADGYPRLLSNRGSVLIRGKRAAIRGRVCMDQMMVDVTDIPGVRTGDEVTLIGRDGTEEITAGELADLTGTIHYEITCGVSDRVPRIVREG